MLAARLCLKNVNKAIFPPRNHITLDFTSNFTIFLSEMEPKLQINRVPITISTHYKSVYNSTEDYAESKIVQNIQMHEEQTRLSFIRDILFIYLFTQICFPDIMHALLHFPQSDTFHRGKMIATLTSKPKAVWQNRTIE